MKIKTLLFPVLVILVALPVSAFGRGSAYPDPDTLRITPPKSIGGVSLSTTVSKARKEWGAGKGKCVLGADYSYCEYGATDMKTGYARFASSKGGAGGKVTEIVIDAGPGKNGKTVFQGPLLGFKTAEGIGLGSKIAKVKAAYPKVKKVGGVYILKGRGEAAMIFSPFGTKNEKFLDSISLTDGEQG